MANLLATPALWHIDFDAPPPSTWNGASYAISVSTGTTAAFQMIYNGGAQPSSGDVISGSILFTNVDGLPPGNTAKVVLYDALNADVLASQPVAYGVASSFSFDAGSFVTAAWEETGLNGVTLLLEVSNAPATGFPSYLYGLQLTVAPTATPVPGAGLANVIPVQLRGYVVADTPQVLWARGDAGPLSLAGDVVEAHIRPPGKHVDLLVTPAIGGAAGQLTFTVPATLGDKYGAGLYRITIVSAAYGVTHDGTLEIV